MTVFGESVKKLLCMVLLFALVGCSVPEPGTTGESGGTYVAYELTLSVEAISGDVDDWNFVYTHNGEKVENGYQILLPAGVFCFQSIAVEVTEKDATGNVFRATFPVAICDGGSGKTEIEVSQGCDSVVRFQILCHVKRVDLQ